MIVCLARNAGVQPGVAAIAKSPNHQIARSPHSEGSTMFDMTQALDLGRQTLLTALIVSAPVLGTGVLVGLVVSLIQSITQLQDQTFSIVPKIVAMLGAAIFLIPWLATRLVEYAQAMFTGS